MNKICRICTLKTPALTSVFTFKHDRLISDMISIICPIKIDPSDKFPTNICRACLRIVCEAYDLREKSVQSDMNFKTGNFKLDECKTQTEVKKADKISDETGLLEVIENIKQENDPFNRAIEFVDESFPPPEDENDDSMDNSDADNESQDYDEDFYYQITPVEPNFGKKVKYDRVSVDGTVKYKCPHCEKSFSHVTNVNRHIQNDHQNKKPKKKKKPVEAARHKDIKPTTCNICGIFISHKTNLRRHTKMHHPEQYAKEYEKVEKYVEIIKSSSELTKRFFATPKKQKYMEFINIVSQESENCYRYQCLICIKETNKSKIWSQSISNGGTSNIRRHLSTMHPEEFQRFEAYEVGESD